MNDELTEFFIKEAEKVESRSKNNPDLDWSQTYDMTEFFNEETKRREKQLEAILGSEWPSKILQHTDFALLLGWKRGDKWPENMGDVK